MSLAISALCSPNPLLKPPKKFSFYLSSRGGLCCQPRCAATPFCPSLIRRQSFDTNAAADLLRPSANHSGFLFVRKLGFCARAKNGETESRSAVDKAEQEARGESTMPERFRYLTKEAPDRPVRWPWLIALAFLVYAWRAVLWELYNWKKALASITGFLLYLLKLGLALVFHIIGDPITSLIRGVETALYTIRAFYSAVVAYTPIPELTTSIVLASAILAIGEAAVPDSVNSQQYLLTVAGIIGFAAVRSFISDLFFWTLLFGLYGYARFVRKRDHVSSLLPVAAVLTAVGEPWVRVVVIALYLGLAIIQHSKDPYEDEGKVEAAIEGRKVPVPLLCAAMAIGIRIAAKWAGYRHLTWMVA